MLKFLIRYLVITFCLNYAYYKLLNKKLKKHLNPLLFLIPLIIGSIFYILPPSYRCVVPALHIVLLFFFFLFTDTEVPETIFTALVLSYSISYICYFFSVMIISVPLTFILTFLIKDNLFLTTIFQIVISLFQCLLCYLLFRSKHLRNGIPYLRNPFLSQLGVLLGILITGCTMYFSTMDASTNNTAILPYLASFLAFLILSALIYFWWKNLTHQSYLLQAKERECNRLEEQLSHCQEKLNFLETENAEFSKLIHRDNKLIPSLQLTVHELLTKACTAEITSLSQQAEQLLIQLNQEMAERTNLLNHLSQDRKKLPDTGIPSLNQLLSYIHQRCVEHSVFFECNFSVDVSSVLTEHNHPSEKELSTLLADLLENALISTLHRKGEHIFLYIFKEENSFRIEIWDSGNKFSKEVLYYIGRKRYTTHKSEGGSGIGLWVTWELLKKYQASLIIDENTSPNNFFTKKVIICFDQKSNYILCSPRSKEELSYLKYREDLEIK